jgi:hypothetical protein
MRCFVAVLFNRPMNWTQPGRSNEHCTLHTALLRLSNVSVDFKSVVHGHTDRVMQDFGPERLSTAASHQSMCLTLVPYQPSLSGMDTEGWCATL